MIIDDLRDALNDVKADQEAKAKSADKLREAMLATKDLVGGNLELAELVSLVDDMGMEFFAAQKRLKEANDPDAVYSASLDVQLAADDLQAAAKSLKAHVSVLEMLQCGHTRRGREALADALQDGTVERIENGSHAAHPKLGGWVLKYNEAVLPDEFFVTTRKVSEAKLAAALADGREIPEASRVRGPNGTRISPLKTTARMRARA